MKGELEQLLLIILKKPGQILHRSARIAALLRRGLSGNKRHYKEQ